MICINAGSGQRPFTSLPDEGVQWVNVDNNPRWSPDVLADWNHLPMFQDGSVDLVVSIHSLEHAGCGEADGFIRESHRILKSGGSLIVMVPDPKAIAYRYLNDQIDEYIYNVNTYGAYMGHPSDLHRWSYSWQGLVDYLRRLATWSDVHIFDNRLIPGADIPGADWWFYAMEAKK